jgi:hypothetical protein
MSAAICGLADPHIAALMAGYDTDPGLLRLNADWPVYRLRTLFKLGGVLQNTLVFPPEAIVFDHFVSFQQSEGCGAS